MTLRELRRKARLRQRDLAKKISVDQSAVSHWENGKNAPHRRVQKKLCRVLECTMEELEKAIQASRQEEQNAQSD